MSSMIIGISYKQKISLGIDLDVFDDVLVKCDLLSAPYLGSVIVEIPKYISYHLPAYMV